MLFIRRAIPSRQMGIKKIGEHGLAMLETSIADTARYHDLLIVSICMVIMGRLKALPH